ncbi:hypothetical protein quinque_009860 [Culex quinquefasciatus]
MAEEILQEMFATEFSSPEEFAELFVQRFQFLTVREELRAGLIHELEPKPVGSSSNESMMVVALGKGIEPCFTTCGWLRIQLGIGSFLG